jgi:FAD/FMN-containing dehydrogenase
VTRTFTSYDGGNASTPRTAARPRTVEELRDVLRDVQRYPSPVRALGSFHSLTPCPSSTGTVVDMSGMRRVLEVDRPAMTVTVEAGIQHVDAARELRRHGLQFFLNIEIGNATVGSLACCHSKDAMDGVRQGQVSSFVTRMRWVDPAGELRQASEDDDPELLHLVRSGYGLFGVVYEVTLRVKPLEIVKFDYEVHDALTLRADHVDGVVAANQAMVCWTIGRTTILQTRNATDRLVRSWLAKVRYLAWTLGAAFIGRNLRRVRPAIVRRPLESAWLACEKLAYRALGAIGGFSLYGPDKIMNYRETPSYARYAFTFWAFPRRQWIENLRAYVEFSEDHFRRTGFRCNMPLGSYFIKEDRGSLLSYSYDGDVLSLDPIHSFHEDDEDEWYAFLREFNEWAHRRGGIPLLNQSPFVERKHVTAAYGDRWQRFSDWVREVDPSGRMCNQFFVELLAERH